NQNASACRSGADREPARDRRRDVPRSGFRALLCSLRSRHRTAEPTRPSQPSKGVQLAGWCVAVIGALDETVPLQDTAGHPLGHLFVVVQFTLVLLKKRGSNHTSRGVT